MFSTKQQATGCHSSRFRWCLFRPQRKEIRASLSVCVRCPVVLEQHPPPFPTVSLAPSPYLIPPYTRRTAERSIARGKTVWKFSLSPGFCAAENGWKKGGWNLTYRSCLRRAATALLLLRVGPWRENVSRLRGPEEEDIFPFSHTHDRRSKQGNQLLVEVYAKSGCVLRGRKR